MQAGSIAQMPATQMSPDSIADFLQHEQTRGASKNALRRCKGFANALYQWLPEDKVITRDLLRAWRQNLRDKGYSASTELNYVKGINRYLDYIGRSDLRFNRGKPKDIAGQQFGYLTAVERTGSKHRKDYIWLCQCKCGKTVELPATRLLTGNTLSCGCLLGERLKKINQYYGGTSLRQAMEERIVSAHASSGYTGVTQRRGKWFAYIQYKGTRYSLGYYAKLEDAVKARARAKELVQEDALGLLDAYKTLHQDDPEGPTRAEVRKLQKKTDVSPSPPPLRRVLRSNNKSGCPGVFLRHGRWTARITYQKVTYHLGIFADKEGAVSARLEAETLLETDSALFQAKYQTNKAESEK